MNIYYCQIFQQGLNKYVWKVYSPLPSTHYVPVRLLVQGLDQSLIQSASLSSSLYMCPFSYCFHWTVLFSSVCRRLFASAMTPFLEMTWVHLLRTAWCARLVSCHAAASTREYLSFIPHVSYCPLPCVVCLSPVWLPLCWCMSVDCLGKMIWFAPVASAPANLKPIHSTVKTSAPQPVFVRWFSLPTWH